jgi:hypothetical protein
MEVITSAPIIYSSVEGESEFIPFEGNQDLERFIDVNTGEEIFYSASGDAYYNAKGEKLKGFFKKVGKGLVKGAKAVGKAIKNAVRWVATKSKNLVKGARKGSKGAKVTGKPLKHRKTAASGGADVFVSELPPATPQTPPSQVVTIEGQKFAAVDVPANKPIVVATDPSTGQKSVGVEYMPSEVTGVEQSDGTFSYYKPTDVQNVQEEQKGKMSTAMKIGLAVGGLAVVGVIVYFVVKKNK